VSHGKQLYNVLSARYKASEGSKEMVESKAHNGESKEHRLVTSEEFRVAIVEKWMSRRVMSSLYHRR
jgi:hypothetical protein